MIYIATIMIIVYYLIFLLYYQKLYPSINKKKIVVIFTLVFLCAMYMILYIYDMRWLNFPVAILIMAIALKSTTVMQGMQAIYGAILSVVSVYCFRGIFAAIYALFENNGNNPLHDDFMYNMLTIFAIPVALLYFYFLHRTLLPDKRLKLVVGNKHVLRPIVIYQLIAALTLMIINAGRGVIFEVNWYSAIALSAFFLIIGILTYIVVFSADFMEMTDYKWRTKLLEEQYTLQIRHYNTYKKYTEEFRVFRRNNFRNRRDRRYKHRSERRGVT